MKKEILVNWKLPLSDRTRLLTNTHISDLSDKYSKTCLPKVLGIIQARTTSSRLPNKIYRQINGAPLLYHVINKVSLSSYISEVIVATTEDDLDIPEGIKKYVYPGKTDDVLGRYFYCALFYEPDYIVRVTSDCPAIDPLLLEYMVYLAIINKSDYCSNVLYPLTFPDGQDIEVLSIKLLRFLHNNVFSEYNREHVTMAFRENNKWHNDFNTISIKNLTDYSKIKCSVDTEEDMKNLEKMEIV